MALRNNSVEKLLFIGLISLSFCGLAHGQTFNVFEGLGGSENNWLDMSSCSDNFSDTSYIYQGSSSIKVTYTGSGQGFHLVNSLSFQAGYFSALSLTITGGTVAGRSINVSFDVNGSQTKALNLNTFIQGGSVGQNQWRIVTIPLAAFGIQPTDSISGFTFQNASSAAQPAFWIGTIGWAPIPPPMPVLVSVNATKSLRSVDQKLFGVNTPMWNENFTSASNRTLLTQSQFKSFRYPGGSKSDLYDWSTNTNTASGATWATDFDQFASYAAKASGGQSFITVNYGTGTPDLAAKWVAHSNVTKKYGFKYWEVGNEVYNQFETDEHARPNDPKIYATQFVQYYKQMKAVDRTIHVGAVASPGEDYFANYSDEAVTNPRTGQKHSGWTAVMLSTMASLGVTPDFLVYHRYPDSGGQSDFLLLVSNSSWASDMTDLRQQLKDYLGAANSKTQIMCTENNSNAGAYGKQMVSLVNGLFMADTFGTVLQTECNSFEWWNWINWTQNGGPGGPWVYGWRTYGDLGVVSSDFTQSYPCFWMEKLLNTFAATGDQVLPTTSSYGLLTAFATKHADGTIQVMVVNKHDTKQLTAQISFAGYKPVARVTSFQYGMTEDNLAKAGMKQKIERSSITNWSVNSNLTFPPYSVTVLVFSNR